MEPSPPQNARADAAPAIADPFGIAGAGRLADHERNRATLRLVTCVCVLSVWLVQASIGTEHRPATAYVAMVVITAGLTAAARAWLAGRTQVPVTFATIGLIADPLLVATLIALDPETFALANALMLVVVIRTGLRYGLRCLHASWLLAIVASVWVLLQPYWQDRHALSLAYVFLLILVPASFARLIRDIEHVRQVEETRALALARDRSLQERATFLSKVSHELRSPLQSMVSSLDVFEMRHLDAARGDAELISRMRRASLLLNTQLRDLLTLAKGEAGRLDVRPEAFEAGELVQAMAEAARPLAQTQGLALVVRVPDAPIFVFADGSRIDQILTNLVVNSIRYTERGSVHVVLHPFDLASRRLRFTVADTGRGISEAELPTLFVPEREGATTARRGEGSGIGLAIVRILVEQLGGSVSVSSRMDKGTTFDFEVAAEPVDIDSAMTETTGPAIDPDPSTSFDDTLGPPTRILVVDDRADVLGAIAGVIDEIGYLCDRASSAAEAANLFAARRYELALLDLEMPGTGGAQIAEDLRRGGGPNADIRLIAMTAGDPPATGGRAASHTPFDGWLAKPVDSHALRRAVLGTGRESRPSQAGLFSDTVVPSPAASRAARDTESAPD